MLVNDGNVGLQSKGLKTAKDVVGGLAGVPQDAQVADARVVGRGDALHIWRLCALREQHWCRPLQRKRHNVRVAKTGEDVDGHKFSERSKDSIGLLDLGQRVAVLSMSCGDVVVLVVWMLH